MIPHFTPQAQWSAARWSARRYWLIAAKDSKQAMLVWEKWYKHSLKVLTLKPYKAYAAKNGAKIIDLGRNNV